LYRANLGYIEEVQKQNLLDQLADFAQLKGAVYKRKTLSPKRIKGVGAFAASLGLYSYLPYLTVYLGSTVPVFTAVAAGVYGMLAFAESKIVNEIRVVEEGEHQGKLRITVGASAFVSYDILTDVKSVQSVVSLRNDDLGEEGLDGNVICVSNHINEKTGEVVNEPIALTLSGDAYRDRLFLDWIISNKSEEGSLSDDYNDLLYKQF
jgi:hypothetical protein